MKLPNGVEVEWDGHKRVVICMPSSVPKVCGICGDKDSETMRIGPHDASTSDCPGKASDKIMGNKVSRVFFFFF